MGIDFSYTDEDFKEATNAQRAFHANKPIKPEGRYVGAARKFARNVLGWILFVVLAVLLLIVVHGKHPVVGLPIADAPKDFSHNSRLTADSVCIGPLALIMLFAWGMSITARAPRAPFFAPKNTARRWPRAVWRIIALLGFVAWVAALIDFGSLQTNPDWWPGRDVLILIAFLPWGFCFLFLGVVSSFLRRFGPSPLGNAESSLREQRRLEATDTGVTIASASVRCEFSWTYFVSYLESANLLIMFTRDLTMYIVPKRAFADEPALFEFCSLLQNQIPAGQFLTRVSGFPVQNIISQPANVVDDNT